MKAIVYRSNTGFTEKYARLLGERLDLSVFSLDEAVLSLSRKDRVIYMGWLMAGRVIGLKRAMLRFTICAVCGVGMSETDQTESMKKKHKKCTAPMFYLQGGFDMTKLHGIYRLMMRIMEKVVRGSAGKKDAKAAESGKMIDVLENGGDFVSAEKLSDVVKWARDSKFA